MPLSVKQGRKIGIFLKPNVPTDKNSFVEREVYVTLQGSKTGKETKVKLKIKAGRRHAPIQSNSGAVTLSESGQIVETFNPNQVPEELIEIIKEEKIIEKLDLIEEEKILDIPDIMDEVEPPLPSNIKEIRDMIDTDALKKLAGSGGISNLANLGNLGNLGNLNLGLGKDPAPKKKKKASPSTAAVVTAAKAAAAKAAAAKKAAALVSKLSSKGIGKKTKSRNPLER